MSWRSLHEEDSGDFQFRRIPCGITLHRSSLRAARPLYQIFEKLLSFVGRFSRSDAKLQYDLPSYAKTDAIAT
ncbi:MAG: hypothetical protein WBB29_21880 [Geitlerinemataceae cyanobacterium]